MECWKRWSNSQYSKRKRLNVTGIPYSSKSKVLEQIILKVFKKMEVMVDAANVEDCYEIKTSNGSKNMTTKLSK